MDARLYAVTLSEAFFLSILQGQFKCHLLQEVFPDTLGGTSPPSRVPTLCV